MCHTGGLLRRSVSMVVQTESYGLEARFAHFRVADYTSSGLRSRSLTTRLQARFDRREPFWLTPFFRLAKSLVDVEIPRDDHFTVVAGEHLFQELFGR
jgi:hypothetical protein